MPVEIRRIPLSRWRWRTFGDDLVLYLRIGALAILAMLVIGLFLRDEMTPEITHTLIGVLVGVILKGDKHQS